MPFATFGNDSFAHHGRQLIGHFLDNYARRSPTDSLSLPPSKSNLPVGILGAGPCGLYTALILNDLGIPYKIIEARDRVGGRLYTHTFPNSTGAPYNYFDVGAMRFPEISAMQRLFHLFDYAPLNTPDIGLKAKLNPYYFKGAGDNNTLMSFNGVTMKQNAVPAGDPFKSSAVILDAGPGGSAQCYIDVGVKAIVDDVIEPFATRLLADLANGTHTGWEYMMQYDHYSTRAYMSIAYRPGPNLKSRLPDRPLPTDVINWLETFDKSTGWYDRALSETVLEAVAFGWSPQTDLLGTTKWWCLDGGAFQLANCMHKYIRSQKPDAISFNKRVTSIGLGLTPTRDTVMEVITDGVDRHQFCHVISSIPLPVMRTIELDNAGLTPMQSNAMRQLDYGPSIKVGMQFHTAWWTTAKDKNGNPLNIVGGQTYTDRPLRTVVYPSFGDVMAGKTTTLIASYCWTEDAGRLGALIGNGDQVLVDLVLRELAIIHSVTVDFLRGQLIDTFSWNWSRDPYTMGAFAFFGPGKFGNAYQSLNTPAGEGRLHFAGEAVSVRHAWVEGALDSAWRAVFEMIIVEPAFRPHLLKFFRNWGMNAEWFKAKVLPADVRLPKRRVLDGTLASLPGAIPSADIPSPEIDLNVLLQGSLLIKSIGVAHPELF